MGGDNRGLCGDKAGYDDTAWIWRNHMCSTVMASIETKTVVMRNFDLSGHKEKGRTNVQEVFYWKDEGVGYAPLIYAETRSPRIQVLDTILTDILLHLFLLHLYWLRAS